MIALFENTVRDRRLILLLAVWAVWLLAIPVSGSAAHAKAPPFTAIQQQKVELPDSIKEAAQPAFTRDGKHLLFWGDFQLWIVGTNGSKPRCLTCDASLEWKTQPPPTRDLSSTPANDDAPDQPGLIQPFPDGKRVFFGPYRYSYVLECMPSLLNCEESSILPVDYSPAQRVVIPAGGVVSGLSFYLPVVSSPKLSPDGQYVGFSDIRTDAIQTMVLAKLTRGENKYTADDARVLNPAGPTSVTDPDVDAWSRSAGLFEFKTFVDGGRSVTYVQVGGEASGNPDIWKLDLATGMRTRLTSHPDWDEDMSISPDGRSMVAQFARSTHLIDRLGSLLPFRGFFDAPMVAAAASYYVSNKARELQCYGGNNWLLPAGGDDGARLMGQPMSASGKSDVILTGNLNGWPQWSPDSTAIVTGPLRFSSHRPAGFLAISRLASLKPTKPLTVASSAPGSWAPTQEEYHGALAADTTVTLHGKASGTVTVTYGSPNGIRGGSNLATFVNYSDDGRTFLSGTDSIDYPHGVSDVHSVTHLTMTGTHRGYINRDVTFKQNEDGEVDVTGRVEVNYDGKTLIGPRLNYKPCNSRAAQFRQPLKVKARRTGKSVKVKVEASFSQAGANQLENDRRPVAGATVRMGSSSARTNRRGIVRIRVRSSSRTPAKVRVSAGSTFKPTKARILSSRGA